MRKNVEKSICATVLSHARHARRYHEKVYRNAAGYHLWNKLGITFSVAAESSESL